MNPVSFGSVFKITNPASPAKARVLNDVVDGCEEKGYCVYDTFIKSDNGCKVITTIEAPDEANESLGEFLLRTGIGFSVKPKTDY